MFFVKLLAMRISSKNFACVTLLKDSSQNLVLFFSVHFKIANECLMLNNVREIIVHIYIYTHTDMDFYFYMSLMLKDLLVFSKHSIPSPGLTQVPFPALRRFGQYLWEWDYTQVRTHHFTCPV